MWFLFGASSLKSVWHVEVCYGISRRLEMNWWSEGSWVIYFHRFIPQWRSRATIGHYGERKHCRAIRKTCWKCVNKLYLADSYTLMTKKNITLLLSFLFFFSPSSLMETFKRVMFMKGNVSLTVERWGDAMMGCHTHGQGLSEGQKERKRRKFSTFLTGRDNKVPSTSGGKTAIRNEAGLLRQELLCVHGEMRDRDWETGGETRVVGETERETERNARWW